MKGLRFLAGFVVAVLALTAATTFAAEYTEIQNNAFDGVNDATYVNHILTWSSSDVDGFNILTLIEDTGIVPGYTGNVNLTMSSTFQDYNTTLTSPPRAYFTGGLMELTFDYSADLVNWGSYELSGPISQGSVEVTSHSPSLSTLTGIFNFDTNAGVELLPSSNNWPAPGESTAVALTFAIGFDLGPWQQNREAWDVDIPETPGVVFDTQFSMFPEERPIPEPASLLLLALGGIALFRRRG